MASARSAAFRIRSTSASFCTLMPSVVLICWRPRSCRRLTSAATSLYSAASPEMPPTGASPPDFSDATVAFSPLSFACASPRRFPRPASMTLIAKSTRFWPARARSSLTFSIPPTLATTARSFAFKPTSASRNVVMSFIPLAFRTRAICVSLMVVSRWRRASTSLRAPSKPWNESFMDEAARSARSTFCSGV